MLDLVRVRNAAVTRARRRMEDDLHRVRRELGIARETGGLSYEAVASACGVSPSTAYRAESGVTRNPDLLLIAGMAGAVGRDLRLQIYLGGDALRDMPQQRLLERLRGRLSRDLVWRTEVPLPDDTDHRAWDAVIRGESWSLPIEAETVLRDIQAVERRLALKMRDGRADRAILLLADTRRNRRAAAAVPAAFAGFSRDARVTLRALRGGDAPRSSCLLFL
jgi:transcriptional regulator with XRE-family HTH domain